MSQTLDEFVAEVVADIEGFATAYRAKHAENPEHYPLQMREGDDGLWLEFFVDYMTRPASADEKSAHQNIQELIQQVREWIKLPGNAEGGIFHVVLEDGNVEQEFSDMALEAARQGGDAQTIELAEKIAALSDDEREQLCNSW